MPDRRVAAVIVTGSAESFDVEAMITEAADAGDDDRRLALTELVRLGREYTALDERAPAAGFGGWLRATLRRDSGEVSAGYSVTNAGRSAGRAFSPA